MSDRRHIAVDKIPKEDAGTEADTATAEIVFGQTRETQRRVLLHYVRQVTGVGYFWCQH